MRLEFTAANKGKLSSSDKLLEHHFETLPHRNNRPDVMIGHYDVKQFVLAFCVFTNLLELPIYSINLSRKGKN